MIVENAERFGLSQLHQLRGRVGRGKRKSWCILVTGDANAVGERSRARLETMHTTYDGFAIAEQDLALRGPGDFFRVGSGQAIRQSGGIRFRLADLCDDSDLMTQAATAARELLNRDPTLSDHPALRRTVEELFCVDSGTLS
jgi:ATP-dependent DNA helicase RecG